ncbi:MAG: 4-alpha-glucanotransferase [Candidatus Omnitrophota bacterium]
MASAIVFLFLISDLSWAVPNALSPLVGNPDTYAGLEQEMQRRYDLHNDKSIDPFIRSHIDSIYSLTGTIDPDHDFAAERKAARRALEEALAKSGAEDLLDRLESKIKVFNKATGKIETGARIQLLLLKNGERFPVFEGEEARGHASNKYLTVFVREGELSDIPSIVGRIFHEIRARSHRPDQELREFERINRDIELEVKKNGLISDPVLRKEFARLDFPEDIDIIHRDYMTAGGDESRKIAGPSRQVRDPALLIRHPSLVRPGEKITIRVTDPGPSSEVPVLHAMLDGWTAILSKEVLGDLSPEQVEKASWNRDGSVDIPLIRAADGSGYEISLRAPLSGRIDFVILRDGKGISGHDHAIHVTSAPAVQAFSTTAEALDWLEKYAGDAVTDVIRPYMGGRNSELLRPARDVARWMRTSNYMGLSYPAMVSWRNGPDSTTACGLLISETVQNAYSAFSGESGLVYHSTNIKSALSIIRHGFYGIPGMSTFDIDPRGNVFPSGVGVKLAMRVPDRRLAFSVSREWLHPRFTTEGTGARLPEELRVSWFSQPTAENSMERQMEVAERSGFLTHIPVTIDVEETLRINAIQVKQKKLDRADYASLVKTLKPGTAAALAGRAPAAGWWSEKVRGGILCPLFSGRRQGDQGIGDLKWLDDFIDFMANQNADMLVLLPTTQINPGESCPYVSISLFANNAIGYLPLDEMIPARKLKGYIKAFLEENREFTRERIDSARSADKIDYALVMPLKEYCLRREFEEIYPGIARGDDRGFNAYAEENRDWLENYAIFHSLLKHNGGKPWWEWDSKYKDRDAETLKTYVRKNRKEVLFYQYLQWLYYSRWQKSRAHAREKGKFIIGDVPIYPAPNSADLWANQDIFDMTKNAGAPPEPIGPEGQNWGTHPYRWDEQYDRVLKFWEVRIRYMAQFYDGLRVDHLLGLCSEWLIDIGRHATTGQFYPASPEEGAARGEKILRHLARAAEEENTLLIGEDIGDRPEIIRDMLDGLSLELSNLYLYNPVGWRQKHMAARPHVMVVEATHDTEGTFAERYSEFSDTDRAQVSDFLNAHGVRAISETPDGIQEQVLEAMREEGFYCFTLQTLLGKRDARVNKPGTVGPHNWTWRSPEVESLLKLKDLGYFSEAQKRGDKPATPGTATGAVMVPGEFTPDIRNALTMRDTVIPEREKADHGTYYTVRYNKTKIPQGSPAEALLKVYVEEFLSIAMPGEDRFKLIGSDREDLGIIWVECYKDPGRDRKIGEGHVDIGEDIDGRVLRIPGMMNMAIVASHIPIGTSPDEIMSEYDDILSFIRMQYREMTGGTLTDDKILEWISKDPGKGLSITLPHAGHIPTEERQEYYERVTVQLQQAA